MSFKKGYSLTLIKKKNRGYKKSSTKRPKDLWVKRALWLSTDQAYQYSQLKKNIVFRKGLSIFNKQMDKMVVFKKFYKGSARKKLANRIQLLPWNYVKASNTTSLKLKALDSAVLFNEPNRKYFWYRMSYWRSRRALLGHSHTPFYAFMRLYASLIAFQGRNLPKWNMKNWESIFQVYNTFNNKSFNLSRVWNYKQLVVSRPSLTWARGQAHQKIYPERFILRDMPLIKNNRELLKLPIHINKIYKRLFKIGRRSKESSHFFMQKERTLLRTATIAQSFTYNYIFADIYRFKLWFTRRFWINTIYFKKLLYWYIGCKKRIVNKTIVKVQTTKQHKLSKLYSCFQYSLFAVVHISFIVLGLKTLMTLIRRGYIWVNGSIEINPFRPCFKNDFIQLDIFKILRRVRNIEAHTAVWNSSIAGKSSGNTFNGYDRFINYIPIFIKTIIPKTPRRLQHSTKSQLAGTVYLRAFNEFLQYRSFYWSVRTRQSFSFVEEGNLSLARYGRRTLKKGVRSLAQMLYYIEDLKPFEELQKIEMKEPTDIGFKQKFLRSKRARKSRLDGPVKLKSLYTYFRTRYLSSRKPSHIRYLFNKTPSMYSSIGAVKDINLPLELLKHTELARIEMYRTALLSRNDEKHTDLPLKKELTRVTLAHISLAVARAPHKVKALSRKYRKAEAKAKREAKALVKKFKYIQVLSKKYKGIPWGQRRSVRLVHQVPLMYTTVIKTLFRLKTNVLKVKKNTAHKKVTASALAVKNIDRGLHKEARPIYQATLFNILETINARHSLRRSSWLANRRQLGSVLKRSVLVSGDTFTAAILSNTNFRFGRQSYLNEDNLRFLISYN